MEKSENAPLIFEAKPLVKISTRYRKLSNNSSEWGRQIQDALYNEHKQLNTKKMQIQWESKDDATGNAVGRVTVDGKIAIPIIVQNFKLAPLDTFTDRNVKPHRISPKRLKQALFTPDLFSGVVTPQQERGLMPDVPLYRSYGVLPWEEGRRVYASLLDEVLPTATKSDLEKFADILNSEPQFSVNFNAYDNNDIISKILHTRPTTLEKCAEDLMASIPVSVVQLRFLPDHTLIMKMASDSVYAPQEVVLDPSSLAPTLRRLGIEDTSEALEKAASPFGFNVTLHRHDVNPVFDTNYKETQTISKFGHYVVKDISGKEHRGYVFPMIYSLGKEAIAQSLFFGESLNAMQSKIAGVVNPNAPEEIPSCLPSTGDIGCFVYEKESNAVALEPLTIDVMESSPEGVIVTASTYQGQPVRLCISKVARDLVCLDTKDTPTYLIPASMKFCKLSQLQCSNVLVGDSKTLTKIAKSDALGPDFCKVTSPLDGRLFLFQGPIADKMGCAGVEQYPDEAMFKLACMGLSAEDASSILDRAQASHEVVVGGLRSIRPAKETLGQEKRAQNMQLLASLPQLKQDTLKLMKIAGDIQDPASVDRILALNFLNPQNIGVLVDHMRDLESTGIRLSEMLIARRMGAKEDLNESAIMQARQAIDDVLDGLANLKSRLGPQTSTEETGGTPE